MRMKRVFVGLVVLGGAIVSCGGDNTPGRQASEFRDCSLVAGVDPDFVELSGAIMTSDGGLTVLPSQNSLGLTASESSDPGDSAGHVTRRVRSVRRLVGQAHRFSEKSGSCSPARTSAGFKDWSIDSAKGGSATSSTHG